MTGNGENMAGLTTAEAAQLQLQYGKNELAQSKKESNPANAPVARAMGLTIIMLSNLLLVQVNSSDKDFAFQSISRLSKDRIMWAANIGTLLMLITILYTPFSGFLKLAPLSAGQFFCSMGIAALAVLWYELVKLFNRLRKR
jgi:Ca2+-transporting ATPase